MREELPWHIEIEAPFDIPEGSEIHLTMNESFTVSRAVISVPIGGGWNFTPIEPERITIHSPHDER